jgi:hypothetical protein
MSHHSTLQKYNKKIDNAIKKFSRKRHPKVINIRVDSNRRGEKKTKQQILEQQILKEYRLQQQRFDELAKICPKHLLLFITTHGSICVWGDVPEETETFGIPLSIKRVSKLNFAPEGVSSLMTALSINNVRCGYKSADLEKALKEQTHLKEYYALIKEKMLEFHELNETNDLDYLQSFMVNLQKDIKTAYEANMPPSDHPDAIEERYTLPRAVNLHIWTDMQLLRSDISEMESNNQYVHFLEKQNRQMVNKRFDTGNPANDRSACPLNFGIYALNLKDQPYVNIFPYIRSFMGKNTRSHKESLYVKTSNIFEFISNIKDNQGNPVVETVSIIDTSCSNFPGNIQEHKANLTDDSIYYGYGPKKSKSKSKSKKNYKKYT